MSGVTTQLAELLGKADRPGDFYTHGKTTLLAPSLSVDGVGPIALPLLAVQARQLVAVAERAPYGRGPDTIIDPAVRNTWQIGPDRAHIGGRHWPQTLVTMLERVAEGLGVSDPIEAEFYKMLIYDEGSFFVSHRDTEKTPGMFATLVIALPSICSGGELIVRHKDRSAQLDLRTEDAAEAAFAAFYADCLHEVLPVTAGCRLVLIYNLIRRGKGSAPQPPNYATEQDKVAALLRDWRASMDADGDAPEKLVYPLEHAYTAPELSFAVLKGADAAASRVLAAAARQADCALHLALVTLEEFGQAEYGDNYGRRRRWSHDDDDEDDFEAGDPDDWTITLSDWRAPEGDPVPWGEFPVTEDELSPPDPFHALDPDELHFEEASGNAGVSFERRYRRAALVVWPNDRSLAVLTQAGLHVTVPYLLDLARRWAASGEDVGSAVWQQAHKLAGFMTDDWPEYGGGGARDADSAAAGMLAALTMLGDTDAIVAFLGRLAGTGLGYETRDNAAIIAALRLFPPDQAASLIAAIVTGHAEKRFAACADLLARASAALPLLHRTEMRDAAATLLAHLPRKEPRAYGWSSQNDTVDSGFVANLLVALGAIDPGLADRAVTQILSDPNTFGFDAILVPAMRDKLREAEQPAVARLRSACLEHLRARIALDLSPPADWQRPSAVTCRCTRCAELSRFLADGTQKTWTYRAVEADRRHVEESIRASKCDLDTVTETRGRPYSLICTKNEASYQRRVTQRKQDLRDEASLAR